MRVKIQNTGQTFEAFRVGEPLPEWFAKHFSSIEEFGAKVGQIVVRYANGFGVYAFDAAQQGILEILPDAKPEPALCPQCMGQKVCTVQRYGVELQMPCQRCCKQSYRALSDWLQEIQPLTFGWETARVDQFLKLATQATNRLLIDLRSKQAQQAKAASTAAREAAAKAKSNPAVIQDDPADPICPICGRLWPAGIGARPNRPENRGASY
jgi:hypothetical protein